jgi:pyruvate formate lyase activating enzyme
MPRAIKTQCLSCFRISEDISDVIGLCAGCIKKHYEKIENRLEHIHEIVRSQFSLPGKPLKDCGGITCSVCMNECVIGEDRVGFCGLRKVSDGKLLHLGGTEKKGVLSWYRDPLPTNCVASWICEGSDQRGFHNLAVFYEACSMNCLFCQNWHFRQIDPQSKKLVTAEELASYADSGTFCVCFFGGDPSPQMPHALRTSEYLAEKGIRICWETNGMMAKKYLDRAVCFSLKTGGCIKFDLKAFDEHLHRALTGISNRPVLDNFERAAGRFSERPDNPLVTVSTLLVPGYIETDEVYQIARFIAGIHPDIPYSLLAFAPQFYMSDMPFTSARHAKEAEKAAYEAGLTNVHIGNRHLLGL